MIFGIKEKSIILTPTMYVLLAIATNTPMLLMTRFIVQGHICTICVLFHSHSRQIFKAENMQLNN